MRDPLAPVINGFDFSGIVNRYSLQCDQFYTEGDNGGTLLDGSTVTDVLAAHVRLSWTLNSVSSAQYAEITAALGSGDSPDTVSAYVFDPSADALRLAKFHVTRPPFQFAFDMNAGKMMSYAGGELVLEEASAVARFSVTPPTKTAYVVGEPLDLTGFSVTSFDNDGVATDITDQCTTIPANGTPLSSPDAAPVLVTVSLPVAPDVSVTLENISVTVDEADSTAEIIDSGDWWRLYADGILSIFCVGDMPPPGDEYRYPWFRNRDQILTARIHSSVTSIGDTAFSQCSRLTNVTIPNGVTYIGGASFYGCISLTNVTIPNSVTSIDYNAFARCITLSNVTIPSGVTNIAYAFYSCTGLTSVTIPGSVTDMESAFGSCTGLTSVTISDGVKKIDSAFFGCTGLTSVTIPGSVTDMEGAFASCTGLTSVTMSDGLTGIGTYSFSDCTSLTSVSIPSSVLRILDYAFENCFNLTDVYYGGTEGQWNALEDYWRDTPLASATIHYNSTGPA